MSAGKGGKGAGKGAGASVLDPARARNIEILLRCGVMNRLHPSRAQQLQVDCFLRLERHMLAGLPPPPAAAAAQQLQIVSSLWLEACVCAPATHTMRKQLDAASVLQQIYIALIVPTLCLCIFCLRSQCCGAVLLTAQEHHPDYARLLKLLFSYAARSSSTRRTSPGRLSQWIPRPNPSTWCAPATTIHSHACCSTTRHSAL